ncbi:cobalamin biosynthesis protein CobD [Acidimicrobium ferrooxidans DSM 10331]|uniref:Cobalamin biosynthesis protein CobD n=1 Tax=Acidimicrobium ferrooxidans (strain DSM 10331 / JCM 15462 / NBRC 103882 / ICP) TaxID=525909 RepID=C7M3A5_ACIFD|nr:CobD/CbiB family cobalamin biosynthesis protein [Acidimicrobium ferrooxidans]ACU53499.1 cobalamin biosynthesis protein CobD [Acidimicrobium ferrooxidans DSM 10331]
MRRTRSLELAVALGLDAMLGDPPDRWHPVAWFGRAASVLERRYWRDDRRVGALVAGALVVGGTLVGAVIDRVPGGALASAWVALGGAGLRRRALDVARALDDGDLEQARAWLGWLVGRDRDGLDATEIARATIESVAENTVDAVLGPMVWHVALGSMGSIALRAVNTLDAMVGHRNARFERFGWFAARLDDLVMAPPRRLAIALAAPSHRRLLPAARSHPSPNAGPMEALVAAAVGVRLGGVNRYGDAVVELPVLDGGPPPDAAAIRRAVRWSRSVTLGTLAFLAVAEQAANAAVGRAP